MVSLVVRFLSNDEDGDEDAYPAPSTALKSHQGASTSNGHELTKDYGMESVGL